MEKAELERLAAYHQNAIKKLRAGDIAGLQHHNSEYLKYALQLQKAPVDIKEDQRREVEYLKLKMFIEREEEINKTKGLPPLYDNEEER